MNKSSVAVSTIFLLLLTMLSAQSSIIYVRTDGDDGDLGTSWGAAKATIQAGVSVAQAGDEVWVAEGTYVEQVFVSKDVGLYGGFSGDEDSRNDRDWRSNETVIDGNAAGEVVYLNVYGGGGVLDGFRIRNGAWANGAVRCDGGSSVIANNTIAANNSYGISCTGSPIITGNRITDNTSDGITCSSGSPNINSNTISNNLGHGVYYSGSNARITDNVIRRNRYSGIQCSWSGIVTGNVVSGNGGGMVVSGLYVDALIVTGNVVTGNRGSLFGGGITCNGYVTVSRNIVSGNLGTVGGGIVCLGSATKLINNLIIGNRASKEGGGLWYRATASPAYGAILNNTIVGNIAPDGGGLCCFVAVTAANNVIACNSSEVYVPAGTTGTPSLRNNNVYNPDGYNYSGISAGQDDISVDPQLVSLQYGRMHLLPGSPCIDAGWSDAPNLPAEDFDGLNRNVDGNADGVSSVDIGADEWDGTAWSAEPIVVRVSPSGDDEMDGSTWALAKKTLQEAIDAVSALGGEVWAAAGRYDERVSLHPHAFVYGGFAGTEANKSERNWSTNKTIIDGGASGSVVTALTGQRVSAIDGFTIRNGSGVTGGGIDCDWGSPYILNNVITRNNATSGGGIRCYRSSAVVSNNLMLANSADYGGGIDCEFGSPVLTNNTITGNDGDGIFCFSSSAAVSNNLVAFNSSEISCSGASLPALRNNMVFNREGRGYSGISGGEGDRSEDPKLVAPEYGRVHLKPDSPCIDNGWEGAQALPPSDMDARPRTHGARVDIGADEWDGTEYAAEPTVVRVKESGDDANSGGSWETAKKTVQSAVDSASATGGEVWVASGTYPENITLHPYVYLYGGFLGGENTRTERNWSANRTILDGGGAGSVVTARAGYRVSAVDGFTIRNGTGTSWPSEGGGVYCYMSSPTISNNTITGNSADYGAGIGCYFGSPIVSNNIVSGNNGSYGGGIECQASRAVLVNNTVVGNAAANGGGIGCTSSETLLNNIVALNSSGIYQFNNLGTTAFGNNNVHGNTQDYLWLSDITGSNGNISTDPGFLDPAEGDYHLAAGSSCIDAGADSGLMLPLFDMDGEGRVFRGKVDVGADEYWSPLLSPGDAKKAADSAVIAGNGVTVSAAFPGFFYVESDDRSSGIQIKKDDYTAEVGEKVGIKGRLNTNPDGERYIAAAEVTPSGETGQITPLFTTNSVLGGGPFGRQEGIWRWTGSNNQWENSGGLNSIGLFVRICGRLTQKDPSGSYFYMDDGSGVRDGTKTGDADNIGIRVACDGTGYSEGQLLVITGVSSCFRNYDGRLMNLLRVQSLDDIQVVSEGGL